MGQSLLQVWWQIAPTVVAGLGGVLGVQLTEEAMARLRRRQRAPR